MSEDARPPTGARPVTVVTGGSDGIGFELARCFAAHGETVVLVARDAGKLQGSAERLKSEFATPVHVLAVDLAVPTGREAVSDFIEAQGFHVRYLVNSAGIGNVDPFAQEDHDRLMAMVDLNVAALTDLMRRFLPDMLARGAGGVLNLGSLAGFAPGPYQSGYYASKAYVLSLTQAVAHEVRGTGVRVAVATPGPVATGFHRRMGGERALYMHVGMMSAARVAAIAYSGFMRGRTVIVPGFLHRANRLLLQLLPRAVLVPFMGLLLKQRPKGDDVRTRAPSDA